MLKFTKDQLKDVMQLIKENSVYGDLLELDGSVARFTATGTHVEYIELKNVKMKNYNGAYNSEKGQVQVIISEVNRDMYLSLQVDLEIFELSNTEEVFLQILNAIKEPLITEFEIFMGAKLYSIAKENAKLEVKDLQELSGEELAKYFLKLAGEAKKKFLNGKLVAYLESSIYSNFKAHLLSKGQVTFNKYAETFAFDLESMNYGGIEIREAQTEMVTSIKADASERTETAKDIQMLLVNKSAVVCVLSVNEIKHFDSEQNALSSGTLTQARMKSGAIYKSKDKLNGVIAVLPEDEV